MSKISKSTNMIDHINKKYGISKTWIAAQIGLTLPALHYALERGLYPHEARQLESSLRAAGNFFLNFSVPEKLKYKEKRTKFTSTIFDEFKDFCGVSKTWIASQLEMSREGFSYALERGLHPTEQEILEAVFRSMGRDLVGFVTPEHLMQKKEAA